MIANNNNKAMLTRGPMALPMADITTCKPGKTTNHISLIYRGLFILHDKGYGVLTLLSKSILSNLKSWQNCFALSWFKSKTILDLALDPSRTFWTGP